jgi:putative addiction module component (TIGR02574 family)
VEHLTRGRLTVNIYLWIGDLIASVIRVFAMNLNVDSVFDLSAAEKLQLVEDLWDDLAADPNAVPVHDWQKEELARRKANLASNPASGLSWDDVKQRVRARHGR